MVSDAPIESELKFLVAADGLAGLFAHSLLQGPERKACLRSVYYDTPGHDLWAAGLALRVRRTEDGFVQTVKTQQAGAVDRCEWEHSLEREAIDFNALASTPAATILHGEAHGLAPIFSTTVERSSRIAKLGGSRIEVSIDRGEVSIGEKCEPIQELELELKHGEPAALFDLARQLARTAPISLSFESKAERGYRLCIGASTHPPKSRGSTLTPQMQCQEAFRRISLACLSQVTANAQLFGRVRRPEALHQLRIGLRRLRTATALFDAMLTDDERPRLEDEMKWLASKMDAARDLDVFTRGAFRPAARELGEGGLAAVGRQLLAAKSRAYARAVAAVRSDRYRALVLEAAAWIEAGAWTRAPDPVLAERRDAPVKAASIAALDHLRHVVGKRGRDLDRLDPASRHKLRIRAKRLRYAIEFFGPLHAHRRRQADFLARLKSMLDQLGELNDIAVARERLLSETGLKETPLAFAAGRIVGWRERDEPRLLQAALKGYDAFKAAEPFWT